MRTLNHLMDQLISSAVGPRKAPLKVDFGIRYAVDFGDDRRVASQNSQGGESLNNGETSPARQASAASVGGDGQESGGARAERLRRIRAQIEAGVYDTPEKFEAAIDRLYEVLQNDPEPR